MVMLKQTYQMQVYLGELTAGGTHLNPPHRLTSDEAYDVLTAWTPDGKAVLFTSDRGGGSGIFKQGIGQDTAEPVVTGAQHNTGGAALSPNGAWVLFYGEYGKMARPSGLIPLMRLPVGGGAPQLVLEMRNSETFACSRAPASLCVLLETSQDRKLCTLTAFDPLKGRGKVLTTIQRDPSGDYSWSLSPDGSTVAISKSLEPEIHIRLLAISGGSERDITVKGWANLNGSMNWSADGKGFYLSSQSPQAANLLYVDLKGNASVLWETKGRYLTSGMPSPDDRYLAISGTVANSNVWMLEGF